MARRAILLRNNNSIQRPDFVGRILNNIVWNGPVTVGEVKGEDAKDDIYATLLDLIRIGRFSKQSIDSNFYERVIGIHAVDLIVTVYYTCLLDSGLYVMIEICTISMPRGATQLRLYVAACEDLLSVHHFYKNHCQLANDIDSLKSNVRAGMSEEIFRELANSTKNRKRPCPFTVNQ
ncbi:phosphatidylserine decarboxylase [Mucor circinelloides]